MSTFKERLAGHINLENNRRGATSAPVHENDITDVEVRWNEGEQTTDYAGDDVLRLPELQVVVTVNETEGWYVDPAWFLTEVARLALKAEV